MSNRMYDILKWIAQYLIPALGTLYLALAGIWGFPYGQEVEGSLLAIDTFLGACLGISSYNYNLKEMNEELSNGIGDDE